jgi:hypothetical protein
VVAVIADAIEKPYLAGRLRSGDAVQHGKQRGDADTPRINTTGRFCCLKSIVNAPAGAFASIVSPTASPSWK